MLRSKLKVSEPYQANDSNIILAQSQMSSSIKHSEELVRPHLIVASNVFDHREFAVNIGTLYGEKCDTRTELQPFMPPCRTWHKLSNC